MYVTLFLCMLRRGKQGSPRQTWSSGILYNMYFCGHDKHRNIYVSSVIKLWVYWYALYATWLVIIMHLSHLLRIFCIDIKVTENGSFSIPYVGCNKMWIFFLDETFLESCWMLKAGKRELSALLFSCEILLLPFLLKPFPKNGKETNILFLEEN